MHRMIAYGGLAILAAATAALAGLPVSGAGIHSPARTVQAEAIQPPAAVTQVALDLRAVEAASRGRDAIVVADFPLSRDLQVDLELHRFHVTTDETRFVVGRRNGKDVDLAFDPSSIILLRGQVAGYPHSRVFLTVSDFGAAGSIDLGAEGRQYGISDRDALGRTLPPGRLSVFKVTPAGGWALPLPMCGVTPDALRAPSDLHLLSPEDAGAPIPSLQQIEIAVETDYEYFTLFDDLDAAAAYAVQLYAAISDIYIRDVNASVDLAFVRLWDDPNDLFNGPNPLGDFRSYWEQNMGQVERDVAQFFTGRRDLPWGGVAYLNGLCTGNAYSVSAYALGFFADPSRPHVFNRDIVICAHELGHNCDAFHTHDYGLDTCDDENSDPQRGTIMSYCGQTFTGGDANIDLRFHAFVQTIMEEYINGQPCIADDCNGNGIHDPFDIQGGTSLDVNGNGIPDECEDCNGNGVLDPDDILFGTSLDLNLNGIPDECEPDCNGNAVPDDLDISNATSEDLNANNIPDECEADCDSNSILDFVQIQADMSLDLNRTGTLDSCEDCDTDGTIDLVELDHAHNIWIASLDHGSIREYLANVGTLTAVSDDAAIAEGQDLVITPDRRVLVTSRLDDRVLEFDVAGAYVRDLVPTGSGGLDEPAGMTLAPGGNLLVASRGTNSVLEYHGTSGAFIGEFVAAGTGGLVQPFGLAFGPNGNLFVTSNDDQVLEYDGTSGAFVRVFVSIADNGGLDEPRGLLFLPTSDNLLVASYLTDQVLEYDAVTGAFVRQFNLGGTSDRLTLDQPWTLRIGPEGDVYVSRTHDHEGAGNPPLHLTNARVYQFDVESGFLVRAYILGVNSGIEHPTGFDFMPGDATDCNFNQFPDLCDIAGGFSADLNMNDTPDECETVEAVAPDSFTVEFGALVGGTLDDLLESDNAYVSIEQRAAVTVTSPSIRMEVEATTTLPSVSELLFTLEASCTALPPVVPQRIAMFDYVAGDWEQVDDRLATLTDSVVHVTIDTNAGRFVQAGTGRVRAQLSWFDPGNTVFARWQANVDQVGWVTTE